MAPVGVGVHVPLRFLRAALKRGVTLVKTKLATPQTTSKLVLQPIRARVLPSNPHLNASFRHRIGGRWYSINLPNFLRSTLSPASARHAASSPIRSAISRSTAYSPFASTLRPKLTGGAFPRTMGGYSLGAPGVRYFSHAPAAPAQVISQVSSAMRAFIYNGKDQLSFSTYHRHDGKPGKVGVRAQLAAQLSSQDAPGSYIDFSLAPVLTSISPLSNKSNTLENTAFLQALSADFGAMMGSLTAVYSDIKRLASLGDLPVSLAENGLVLRVKFPGCDAEYVESICTELDIRRGIIREDDRFAFSHLAPGVAPFWADNLAPDTPHSISTQSNDGFSTPSLVSSHGDREMEVVSPIAPGLGLGSDVETASAHWTPTDGSGSQADDTQASYYFRAISEGSEIPDSPSYLGSSEAGSELARERRREMEQVLVIGDEDVRGIRQFLEEIDEGVRDGWR